MLSRSRFLPWRLGFMLLLLAALCSCRAGDEKAAGKKEADKEELLTRISGHVLGRGQLLGTYQR